MGIFSPLLVLLLFLSIATFIFYKKYHLQGQDEHLLESPSCIRFLIKLLKPIVSTTTEDKTRKLGCKLLSLRRDADVVRDTTKVSDSSSAAIISKVQEILVTCKQLKPPDGDGSGVKRPELNPKWIALLILEKACLSKISFEGIWIIFLFCYLFELIIIFIDGLVRPVGYLLLPLLKTEY